MAKTKVEIGIIGGCMASQLDLGISNLYHRKLARKLMDKLNIESNTRIKVFPEYYRIFGLVNQLVKNNGIDILILQLRPAPFIKRADFLIDNRKGKYIVNPILLNPFNAKKLEDITLVKDPVLEPWKLIRDPKKLNLIDKILKKNTKIGGLFFLKMHAQRYVLKTITSVHSICAENNIELIVVGALNPINEIKVKLFFDLNNYLMSKLSKYNIAYIDIFNIMKKDKKSFYSEDMFHINKKGHEVIAGLLFEKISNIYNS